MGIPDTFYAPAVQFVDTISNSFPCVVTTQEAHGYKNEMFVRLLLPIGNSMRFLNGSAFEIAVLSPTSFTLDLDSRFFPAYAAGPSPQFAQTVPVGEFADTLANAVHNTTPASPVPD